jgi:PiT family inorganic phosphate transporter
MLGLPTSSSHALIGGLVGSAVAHGCWAVVQFNGLRKILEAMILSPPLGFGIGFLLMVLVSWVFFRVHRGVATKVFSRLQIVSASFMAFSHGVNDAQKVMGVITLALVASGQLTSTEVPTGVIVACAGDGAWNHGRWLADYPDSRHQDGEARTGSQFCR